MSENKKKTALALALFATFWFVVGGVCGFFVAKGMYDQPLEESVTRDTVTITDTIIQYAPKPVSVEKVRTEYKLLPVYRTDTVTQYFGITEQLPQHPQDSALVEIPITSKHYSSEEYDAWVSGYEASLDSIKVYSKETVITETITKVVNKKKHFFLDVGGGCEHSPNEKITSPFAELGLNYKKDKLGIGVYGGYQHTINENKAEPYIRAKITYDIISF